MVNSQESNLIHELNPEVGIETEIANVVDSFNKGLPILQFQSCINFIHKNLKYYKISRAQISKCIAFKNIS